MSNLLAMAAKLFIFLRLLEAGVALMIILFIVGLALYIVSKIK